jgi:hypothetical protein
LREEDITTLDEFAQKAQRGWRGKRLSGLRVSSRFVGGVEKVLMSSIVSFYYKGDVSTKAGQVHIDKYMYISTSQYG